MHSAESTSGEYTIYPDHSSFRDLDWIRIYEISRACLNPRPTLPDVIDPSWNSCNPAELWNLVTEAAKAQKLKPSNPVQMEKNLRLELEERLDDGMKFSELQRNIEYNLIVNLEVVDKKNHLVVELCPPKFAKSTALNRTYGAERFLVVTLSDKVLRELQSEPSKKKLHGGFFTKPWRIGNRVYETFLRKNVSRCALLVSATAPTITFRPENIRRVPDIMSNSLLVSPDFMNTIADALGLNYLPSAIRGQIRNGPEFVWRLGQIPHSAGQASPLIQLWKEQTKERETTVWFNFMAYRYDILDQSYTLEKESMGLLLEFCQVLEGQVGKAEIMTDGAAAISRVAALQISSANNLQPDILPSVYQGRIGFAKGLWYLDPNSNPLDTTTWIEIRDTQWKAEPHVGFLYHFNLCRYSVAVNSTTLGRQNLRVLSSRGIPNEVFEELLEEAIRSSLEAFDTPDPMELIHTLSNESAISCLRTRTLLTHGGASRIEHDPTLNRTFDQDSVPEKKSSDQTSDRLHPFSLQPADAIEQLLCMLEAGFPVSNRIVVEKLRKVRIEKLTKMLMVANIKRRLSVPLSLSCYVYAIPDPDSTGTRHGILAGPALIWRSPCAAPIDVRKIQLVANEHLQRVYFDVIVCSTRGDRAMLSMLSGGDYDGDQVSVTWDKRLVDPFQNADPGAYPEMQEEYWFDNKLAGAIGKRLMKPYIDDPTTFVREVQDIIIDGLFTPSSFSAYAVLHGMCDYLLEAKHPLTLATGWIYVKCLDAAKQGLVLKRTRDADIQRRYKQELQKIGITLDQFGNAPIPSYEKCLARNEKKCLVYEVTTAAFDKYKDGNKSRDKATHSRRALDKDDDLRRYFLDQKKIFDQLHPKSGESSLTDWATAGVWHGILKHMQREIADLQQKYKEMAAKMINEQNNNQAIQEEDHYVPAMGNNKMILMKPILSAYHVDLSLENAYKTNKTEKEFFSKSGSISEKERNAFLQGKQGYLDALGHSGYSLLKASCAASNSRAEGRFPFDVAFRELCYLKAQASMKNTHGNSSLKLTDIEQESLPPWTLDSTSHYAMLSRRMLYSKRHATKSEV
ncbi:uncharacterized protein MELLADRAFT_103030 [Melampsora larici-populina 98AG31]|uniref:RNA-dependent RNA polymerase n=1 Tax=Melampsora larici-populina (strain 98AG31 / pathotype 3-4-7) TaxID=747676 RepID=F4RAB6_MELLP|nr:uncharacterized protein MELLADRAFT_103030 [Melampsora larici-populina 98AG31]EGG10451.1 hypothetical protein MELLADRAFT_103030 [Melampsora larici-populina 98AG31]